MTHDDDRRVLLKWLGAAAAYGLAGSPSFAASEPAVPLDVPYVPTPQGVVNRMLALAKVGKGDLFKTDLSQATVVTLYLLTRINKQLRPQLWKQLKPGTRVVSHAFDMGDEWPPEKTEIVLGSIIYYWTITDEQKRAVS